MQQRDQPAPEPTPTTATDDGSTLTTTRKALYATITLGVGALDYVVVVFLLKYYTDYTGLDARLAGIALLLGKAFDAVSDPIMGYISDHTKSRWGRRRPWFFSGAIPLSLSFIGMFSANPEWSQTQLFFWLVATNVFFWSGNTMVMVPHAAFASEMTETHGETDLDHGVARGIHDHRSARGRNRDVLPVGERRGSRHRCSDRFGLDR